MFFKGLFIVSAGAKIKKDKILIIEININISFETLNFKNKKGKAIKNINDDIKHSLLFLACTPNYLIMLNRNNKINTSFSIFNNKAMTNIIISFVSVKYKPSKPYFNCSISSLE